MKQTVTNGTVPQMMMTAAERFGGAVAYRELDGSTWRSTTWQEFTDKVETAAKALLASGVKPGQVICILGGNRPEWAIMAQAAMVIGCTPTGIYFTCSPDEIAYIVNHSESPLLLVDSAEQLANVQKVRDQMPGLGNIVGMRATPETQGVLGWDAFIARAKDCDPAEYEAACASVTSETDALIVYTSGTVGHPKGVVMKHKQLEEMSKAIKIALKLKPGDRMLSYLPLAHIVEFNNTIISHVYLGQEIWFCSDLTKLPEMLTECHPSVFFGVPRVWQKIQEKLTTGIGEATGIKGKLGRWALATGARYAELELNKKPVPAGLKMQHALADKLVFSKIRAALGLDKCHFALSGGAAIPFGVLAFYYGLGLPIYEMYGQSECGPSAANLPGALKIGTVGKAFPGIEVKLADDGEILVRSGVVFDRYLKDPEATANTLIDGWMHSGDLGQFDDEGYLKIIGRKKDIIITAGGKNVTPVNMENDLVQIPFVEHAVVCGEGQKYLTALLTLSREELEAKGYAIDEAGIEKAVAELRPGIEKQVEEINTRYARVEQVRRMSVMTRVFSQDTGELTATMKVRRHIVNKNFADELAALYAD